MIEQIARHAQRPIHKAVRTKARLHLLDWLGCVAGALRSDAGRLQAGLAHLPIAERAALLGNVLEMDDVHRAARLHPGPVVWPAALGTGVGDLDAVIDAAIRGYEVTVAVGMMLDARHYAFWHNTTTAGMFGAAAACAAALGLDEERQAAAMALAGSVTGGLWQMRHEAGEAKQWHIAHAAATGRAAARMAAAGFTGPRAVLEGPQGLLAATCDAIGTPRLADGWRIDEVSLKPWPACRHAHPAIDAALALKDAGGLSGAIRVETYADALTFCNRPEPATPIEAKFSLQHAVAVVMERGAPRLADFEPEAIAALTAARRRVSVAEAHGFTAAYPDHFGARVSSPSGAVEVRDALGDPELPLDAAAVAAKARTLMEWGGVSHASAEQAVALALGGAATGDILQLLEEWL